jgi:hypothetical protein
MWGETLRHMPNALVSSAVRRFCSLPLNRVVNGLIRSPIAAGIGSVDGRDFRAEIADIAAVTRGAFDVRTQTVPLTDVATAWTRPLDGDKRIVFLP